MSKTTSKGLVNARGVGLFFAMAVALCAVAGEPTPLARHVQRMPGVCRLSADRVTCADVRFVDDASQPSEGYALNVSATGIVVRAATKAGRFYALKTLEQLARPPQEVRDGSKTLEVPCCEIRDWPTFAWRGYMLDEARHFLGKETVKRYIDLMSRVKMNVFHWHLTDDEGWRLELRRHPEVHQKGAVRPDSMGHGGTLADPRMTGEPYGPYYYTQEDVKEILAYAEARNVKVVSEFDMPAHLRELFASHPEFTCRGAGDPAFRSPLTLSGPQYECLCAANEEGMRFVEDVLDEICSLFPSPDIHIGGDECPPNRWQECPKCQALMKELGLSDVRALQTRMTHRFAKFLAARGRRAIAWDEVLSDDMPENLTMQLWRSPLDGRRAAEAGLDVILSPCDWCYYSRPQDLDRDPFQYLSEAGRGISLARAFSFDPFEGLAPKDRVRVRGIECCAWGETLWSWFDLNWKMWPRAFATAEIAWAGPDGACLDDFLRRVEPLNERLVAEYVHAAPVTVHPDASVLGAGEALKPLALVVDGAADPVERAAFRFSCRPRNSRAITYGDEVSPGRMSEYWAAFLVGGTKVGAQELESYVRSGGALFVAADHVADGSVGVGLAGVSFSGEKAAGGPTILNECGRLATVLFGSDGAYELLTGVAAGATPFMRDARKRPVVWRHAVGRGVVYTVAHRRMMPAEYGEPGDVAARVRAIEEGSRTFPLLRYLASRVLDSCRLQPRRIGGTWCALGTSITWYDAHVEAAFGGFSKGYQTRVREILGFRRVEPWLQRRHGADAAGAANREGRLLYGRAWSQRFRKGRAGRNVRRLPEQRLEWHVLRGLPPARRSDSGAQRRRDDRSLHAAQEPRLRLLSAEDLRWRDGRRTPGGLCRGRAGDCRARGTGGCRLLCDLRRGVRDPVAVDRRCAASERSGLPADGQRTRPCVCRRRQPVARVVAGRGRDAGSCAADAVPRSAERLCLAELGAC